MRRALNLDLDIALQHLQFYSMAHIVVCAYIGILPILLCNFVLYSVIHMHMYVHMYACRYVSVYNNVMALFGLFAVIVYTL